MLNKWLRAVLEENPDISDEELAYQLIDSGEEEVILKAVIWYVQSQRTTLSNYIIRSEGRAIVFANPTGPPPVPPAFDPLALRRETLATKKVVPGIGYVPIGEMTVEHHRMRIHELSRTRDGINYSIRIHEQAIVEIEKAGVGCLNEIPGVAA